jgi:hypothetical protein
VIYKICVLNYGPTNLPKKIGGTTSNFQTPKLWHEASFLTITHNSAVTFETYCHLAFSAWCKWADTHIVCEEKPVIIVLKTLDVAIQDLAARKKWRHEFVHPCFKTLIYYNRRLSVYLILIMHTALISRDNNSRTYRKQSHINTQFAFLVFLRI